MAAELLPLALADPERAQSIAEELLAGRVGADVTSVAHQALMIVCRDHGDLEKAVSHGNSALRLARQVGEARTADVLATLGLTLIWAGHAQRGRRRLAEAVEIAPSAVLATVLYRRAAASWKLGDYEAVLTDLRRSIRLSKRRNDVLWEGRAHVLRGDALTALGRLSEADGELDEAICILRGAPSVATGFEAIIALHNRGNVAFRRGDLVGALNLLDQAAEQYRLRDIQRPALDMDRTEVLLTAGLVAEARSRVEEDLRSAHLTPLHRAEMLMVAARAALLDRAPTVAADQALQAQALFSAHGRPLMAHRSRLVWLQARQAAASEADVPDRDEFIEIARAGRRLARDLRSAGSSDLPVLLLLTAQVEAQLGRLGSARKALQEAALTRQHGSPIERSAGWLAAALLAAETSDRRRLLMACRRGLEAIDEYRATIGDLELRALATYHGLDFATLAAESMLTAGDTRGLLWWTERWRGAALGASSGRPNDPELDREIAALRDVTRRLVATKDDSRLVAERASLETAVRSRYRRLRSTDSLETTPGIGPLLDSLGDTVLVCIVNVRGTVYVVTADRGRVTRHEVGPFLAATAENEFARFTLRRAAYGRRVDLPRAAVRLEEALLGRALHEAWHGRHVVIVPPASMLSAPFGLLPSLSATSFTVSPSIGLWASAQRSRRRSSAAHGHVALITGPGLSTRQREVTRLRGLHHGARILSGANAVTEKALAVLDGARVGHIAAHGTFRGDAPLFSSLQLVDGPLMVHDLDRLNAPPESLILSACDSGGVLPIGADEALGLVTSLLAMGTRGVVASVVPVNDVSTVSVMRALHQEVARGSSLAAGLRAARASARDDPLAVATAAAFTAWGA